MERHFNPDRPLFVTYRHQDLISKGKTYKYKDHWPWKETGVDLRVAKTMFDLMRVNHVPEWEKESNIVTTSSLTVTNLETLINRVNQRVKETVQTEQEFTRKRIKKSKIRDKQESLLRTWRNTNDKWTDLSGYYDEVLNELYESQGDE